MEEASFAIIITFNSHSWILTTAITAEFGTTMCMPTTVRLGAGEDVDRSSRPTTNTHLYRKKRGRNGGSHIHGHD